MKPRAIEEKEALQAAKNLSIKTGVTWNAKKDTNGHFVLSFNGIQNGTRGTFKEKMKQYGIEFDCNFNMTTLRGMEPGKVHDYATFSHPLAIQAMAQNQFTFPDISDDVMKKAAIKLKEMTNLEWIVADGEILTRQKVKAATPQQASKDFNQKLKDSGITFAFPQVLVAKAKAANPRVIASGGESNEGNVLLNAYFHDPLEILAISNLTPQIEEKHKEDQEYMITPTMTSALYKAIEEQGKSDQLNGFTKNPSLNKFAKALEILGIKISDRIEPSGIDCYKVKMDSANFEKVKNIVEPPSTEQRLHWKDAFNRFNALAETILKAIDPKEKLLADFKKNLGPCIGAAVKGLYEVGGYPFCHSRKKEEFSMLLLFITANLSKDKKQGIYREAAYTMCRYTTDKIKQIADLANGNEELITKLIEQYQECAKYITYLKTQLPELTFYPHVGRNGQLQIAYYPSLPLDEKFDDPAFVTKLKEKVKTHLGIEITDIDPSHQSRLISSFSDHIDWLQLKAKPTPYHFSQIVEEEQKRTELLGKLYSSTTVASACSEIIVRRPPISINDINNWADRNDHKLPLDYAVERNNPDLVDSLLLLYNPHEEKDSAPIPVSLIEAFYKAINETADQAIIEKLFIKIIDYDPSFDFTKVGPNGKTAMEEALSALFDRWNNFRPEANKFKIIEFLLKNEIGTVDDKAISKALNREGSNSSSAENVSYLDGAGQHEKDYQLQLYNERNKIIENLAAHLNIKLTLLPIPQVLLKEPVIDTPIAPAAIVTSDTSPLSTTMEETSATTALERKQAFIKQFDSSQYTVAETKESTIEITDKKNDNIKVTVDDESVKAQLPTQQEEKDKAIELMVKSYLLKIEGQGIVEHAIVGKEENLTSIELALAKALNEKYVANPAELADIRINAKTLGEILNPQQELSEIRPLSLHG